ncbi:hypothetical protein CASFOL_030689 [Castilleja foliolosa]|uniref:Peptidase C1A papain C-terminal domain-containing protein n=1 Tax=Castilleja foliolosa TaxID=1961234 RepID=A0ABD3C616_9LAMI
MKLVSAIKPPLARHAVTLVGYGVEHGDDYYWIQNSAGHIDKAYIKVRRHLIKHIYYPIGSSIQKTQVSIFKELRKSNKEPAAQIDDSKMDTR